MPSTILVRLFSRLLHVAALGGFLWPVFAVGAGAQSTSHVNGGLLVTPEWVAKQLAAPDLVLLHVGERREYEAEHIPGARYVSLHDLSAPHEEGTLALELPAAEELRAALERLGISDDSRVVVYFGRDWVTPATRVLFTLDHAGLGDRASFLDGGLPAWKRAGHPVTAAAPSATRGRLSVLATKSLVVDHRWVLAHRGAPAVKLVDARAPVFYDGPPHGDHRPGHIPGAVNIPFTSIGDDSLRVLRREQLASLFRRAGIARGDTVVAYCHIGQQATGVLLAAKLLGHPVRLYDGSFQDWSDRSELPVERSRGDRSGSR